jgi:protein arginine kinase activator
MLCQVCGKHEATTYYKQNINGEEKELHLCPECAAKLSGEFSQKYGSFFGEDFASPFQSLFGGSPFLQSALGFAPVYQSAIGGGRRCPTCGMTESELRRSGRTGCADCYHVFSDILTPYIRKLHGSATHVGNAPTAAAENSAQPEQDPLEALRAKLQEAVQAENYEEAARLRDEIRRQEGEAQ